MSEHKTDPSATSGSRLQHHKKTGKVLRSPLAQQGERIRRPPTWQRDRLPEYLWLHDLVSAHEWPAAADIFHRVLALLDEFVSSDTGEWIDGTVSSFALVAPSDRIAALDRIDEDGLWELAFSHGLRHVIALYPECPAAWLLSRWSKANEPDAEIALAWLGDAVLRLGPALVQNELHATRCRALLLARLLQHEPAGEAYEHLQEALYSGPPNDLSAYRIILNQV